MEQDDTENQPTSIKLSYNKFIKISHSIVTKLRSISSESDEPTGMSANELVDWYLETIEEELESEEAYINERRLVKLVIKRMITKVLLFFLFSYENYKIFIFKINNLF